MKKSIEETFVTDPQLQMMRQAKLEGFNEGIKQAAEEVQGWIELHNLNHKIISDDNGWSDQKEADREHGNTIRGLEAIKSKISKKRLGILPKDCKDEGAGEV